MNTRNVLALALVSVLAAAPLSAHHAWPVDRAKQVTVKGMVTGFN